MINPHGKTLINKILSSEDADKILENLDFFAKLKLDKEQIKDAENISKGVYSPIRGFLREGDFKNVLNNTRLQDGTIWPIPIVLDISQEDKDRIQNKKDVILTDSQSGPVAILKDVEIYPYEKDPFAENIFGTLDQEHPGVKNIYEMKKYLIGGEIELFDNRKKIFSEFNFTPAQTREIFARNGWNTVVAFQTRNVPHRGHEFLQKYALNQIDGLFVQPVIGEKKIEDFKDEYILASYKTLIEKHYPQNRVFLGILPLKMRYAGPKEAVFHAIIRKNFGCTHFIVGRDHAGVGSYYTPFAAQEIFDQFEKDEMEIEILKYPEVVYNNREKKHQFLNECPPEDKISFSGTKLREKIKNKKLPPSYIIRPEVYNVLINSSNSLVDTMYKQPTNKNQKGFVLWFTGLSQAGKTTIANQVYEILKKQNIKIEKLDGDVVRESLSKDLGFSKEDRDENIKRVGFVAGLLSRNGVGVLASFISPYQKQRDKLREQTKNFIEVFVNAPLEICEQRDTKGLYKKARNGEINNFTGISDPYENPASPDIELRTDENELKVSVSKVIEYLKNNNFI